MELKELIIELCSLMSISGHEAHDKDKLMSLTKGIFDEVYIDNVGSFVFVKKCGRENAPKILIDTHLDEIGMMVTGYSDGGFLRITNIGGVDGRILQAGEVIIYGKETVYGVIGSTPPHLKKPTDGDKLKSVNELYVDTGYTTDEIKGIAPLGTPVGFKPIYTELQNGRLSGKAFDDKACGASAIFALANVEASELAGDVYFLFSVQEEVGPASLGARVGAYAIKPDYALVMDVTHASIPEVKAHKEIALDSGVSISMSPVTDKKLTRATMALCKEKEIKYTVSVDASSTGTNANDIGLTYAGVPQVLVSVPIKNMHSACEVLSLADFKSLSDLTREFVTSERIAETGRR